MGQFMGIIKGRGGETSRQGTKDSGLLVKANAWGIGAHVTLFHKVGMDEDSMTVYLNFGSYGGHVDFGSYGVGEYKVGSFTRQHIEELCKGRAKLEFRRVVPAVTMTLGQDVYDEGEEWDE